MNRRVYPGYSQDGQTSQRLTGTDFFTTADLGGNVTIGVGVGVTVTRGPFTWNGFNSFMLIVASVTNANVTAQFAHLDPTDDSQLFVRTIGTLAVSAVPLILTWGAFSIVGQFDTYIRAQLLFVNTSGALSPTVASPRLWCSAR